MTIRLARVAAGSLSVIVSLTLFAAPAAADTRATPEMSRFAVDTLRGLKGQNCVAFLSGIVGDAAHARTGGYHISRDDIRRTLGNDYSTSLANDRAYGPGWAASAVDFTLDARCMRTMTQRLDDGMRRGDFRVHRYLRAFNGTVNGSSAVRVEVAERRHYWATPDHLWHVHIEFYRRWAGNASAMKHVRDVILGIPYTAPVVVAPVLPIVAQATLRCPVRHASVLVLQRALNKVGHGPRLRVDGVCGTYTIRALYTFQKREGLPRSKRVTRGTWIAISKAYHR